MLTKKYYDGFIVHDILYKHIADGHKILELLKAFADADGVDAVEVVRCKDCKYWTGYYCQRVQIISIRTITEENEFCSRAERRSDDSD